MMPGREVDRSDAALWVHYPPGHKNQRRGKQRVIYLGPQARDLLAPLLALVLDEPLFSLRRAEEHRRSERQARRKSPPTRSQRGRRPKSDPERAPGDLYDGGSYRKAIRRACKKLGIAIWFPHQLRHTAASEIRRRFGLEASQAVLGHGELGTMRIYAEVDRTAARRIMAEIG